jgi:hypothetical protein
VYPNRATRCRAHEVTLEPWTEFATAAFTDVEHSEMPVATPFDFARPATPGGGELALADTPRSGEVPARGPRRRRTIGGRYRLGRELGVGGYGVVFAAEDQLTGDRVAIKVLAPSATANAESLTRFHREAIATSRIRHPHIVDVADFDVDGDGGHFIVMSTSTGATCPRRSPTTGRWRRRGRWRSRRSARAGWPPRTGSACCTAISSRPTSTWCGAPTVARR